MTDPFYVADLDPAAFSSHSSSCTPLAPISELLSPQPFTSFDLPAVDIPSYVGVASREQTPSFSGQNLTALSSVKILDPNLSLETFAEAGRTTTELPQLAVDSLPPGGDDEVQKWSPGWSMLRQMLSQSHRENAVMHGVVTDGQLVPLPGLRDVTTALPSLDSADCGSYMTLPQNVHASDVLYVEMTGDTDAVGHQCGQLAMADDPEGLSHSQSAVSVFGEVLSPAAVTAAKTVEVDNNNEDVAKEKAL